MLKCKGAERCKNACINYVVMMELDFLPFDVKINKDEVIIDKSMGEGQRPERICMADVKDFTHFNEKGKAFMVDVGEKKESDREAVAFAKVLVNKDTFDLIKNGGMKKGDVLTTAQIAGIMGAKRTPDIIPMCHPIIINGINMDLSLNENDLSIDITSSVKCNGKTGVEMESLTAVSIAALTVYDMCKAVQKDIVITDIKLMKKTGGVHGEYVRS